MIRIEKHISELLFEHDCVIIPDFGGFVCNYSSATIQAGKNQFHPPFKKISFNRNLKTNDGLLANRISQVELIPYPEANRMLAESVEWLNNELAKCRRFDLKNIGTLHLGEEHTLLFEQDETVNYLPDSFGLSTFCSPAIKREPIERKLERTLKDKVLITSKEQKVPSTKFILSKAEGLRVTKSKITLRYMAIAASLLVITSLIFVSLKTDLLKNTHFANLNPFAVTPVSLYQPGKNNLPDNDVTKENLRSLIASNNENDTVRYLNILINGNIPIVVSLKEDKTSVARTKNIKHSSIGHFHIIGGAFAIPENADKFAAKLKNLGYDAQIIDKKLRMVSYGNFSTRKDALEAMKKIREVQGDVWLMRN